MGKLNLVEILKDVPKGTKLYSPLCGIVEFREISIHDSFLILVKNLNNYINN